MYHRKFPNKRISTTGLRRLYLRNGLRRKKVKQVKLRPPHIQQAFIFQCNTVLSQLRIELAGRSKVLYVDETVFSKKAIQLVEWSGPNSNVLINQDEVYSGFRTVIASMSEDNGVDLLHINTEITNQENFKKFLISLKRRHGRIPLVLFLDQLGAHKAKIVKEKMVELNIRPIFNVGYSPEFNPIERVFSKVKRRFNAKRL